MHMHPNESQLVDLAEKARANFECREAIFIEKGALRVRISSISGSTSQAVITANVEEIPTPGLGVGLLDKESRFFRPRWKIGAGFFPNIPNFTTDISDHQWHMGYGGWSLYFEDRILQGVIELASRFPAEIDTMQRYDLVMEYIIKEEIKRRENNRQILPS